MKCLIDASLPAIDTYFSDCIVTRYQDEDTCRFALTNPHDILLCRSTLKVNAGLLANASIQAVATASSGTDHIDAAYLLSRQLPLFDAKGANSEAVADYVVAVLAWLKQQGHTLGPVGIIGMGKVGSLVHARLQALKLPTKTYDPVRALKEPLFQSCSLHDLFECQILSLHANLHNTLPFPSKHMINKDFLNKLSPHTTLINAARGELVDEKALLNHRSALYYCTDVYENEPTISAEIIKYATLCTPHIAGHSIESKLAVMRMLRSKIESYYGLPPITKSTEPLFATVIANNPSILDMYNPEIESHQLKKTTHPTATFLTLRAKHQRHLFSHMTNTNSLSSL